MRTNANWIRQSVLCLAWAALALPGCVCAGVWQGFLKLEGYDGESKDQAHPGWSDVRMFGEGAALPVTYGRGAGATVGRPTFEPLTVTKSPDRTTPGLYAAIARGQTIRTGMLDLVRPGTTPAGKSVSFLRIALRDVLVTGITATGGNDGVVAETLLLKPREITMNSVRVLVVATPQALHLATLRAEPESGVATAMASASPGDSAAADAANIGWSRNLLLNPGAEVGGAAADWAVAMPPVSWEVSDGLTAIEYSALEAAGVGLVPFGEHLFAGGIGDTPSVARQSVDVSPAAVDIDAGRLQAVLSGWLGSRAGDADLASLRAQFRDEMGAVLGTLTAASASAKGSGDELAWERRQTVGGVPRGTRAIEVVLALERYRDTAPGGLADELSLTLEETQADGAGVGVRVQVCRFTDAAERPAVRFAWPANAGEVVIESATRVDGDWVPETRATFLSEGQRVFEVPLREDQSARFWRVRAAASADR